MPKITKTAGLFPAKLTNKVFSHVKGHSSLAKLSASEPIPFSGTDLFTFTMDGEVAIVGEGEQKPSGDAEFKRVSIKPIKIVYQHRLTDEFLHMAEEAQLPYMEAFTDGFSKKIARGLDIMACHGLNPADKTEATTAIGDNCLDKKVTAKVDYAAATADDNIDDAVSAIQENTMEISGVAMAPKFASAIGKIKTKDGAALYPEYRFGGNPGTFGGLNADVNNTISFNSPTNKVVAYVGDFANCFRWGFASNVPMEIIEYGDPDGQGDLKRTNQICLRTEAYIGWGILSEKAFVKIEEGAGV